MHCPFCKHTDTRVLDSRVADDGGAIRRRRACQACDRRFTTVEQIQLVVVKRSGASEPFNRDKVIDGVRKACKGRPVTDDDLARLGQEVETALPRRVKRDRGSADSAMRSRPRPRGSRPGRAAEPARSAHRSTSRRADRPGRAR